VASVFDAQARGLCIYVDGDLAAWRSVDYDRIYPGTAPFMLGANMRSGSVPLTVTFTNTTTGQVSGYGWAFGDGNDVTGRRITYPLNPDTLWLGDVLLDQSAAVAVVDRHALPRRSDVDPKTGRVCVKYGLGGGAKFRKGRIVFLGKAARLLRAQILYK